MSSKLSRSTSPSPFDLVRPWMNAAGSLGFAPDMRSDISAESFGAFVTNPISLRARRAASWATSLNYPGGLLLHTPHPNPGLSKAIRDYSSAWARSPIPIIIHLIPDDLKDMQKAISQIEKVENVIAIELFVGSRNTKTVASIISSSLGELPLIAQLPLVPDIELAELAIKAGAAAISFGPPDGALPSTHNGLRTFKTGKLYGPSVFPMALFTAFYFSAASGGKIPMIAAGGVETKQQGEDLLAAGAFAVQIDIALWKSGSIATI